jgi:hypothetical protein
MATIYDLRAGGYPLLRLLARAAVADYRDQLHPVPDDDAPIPAPTFDPPTADQLVTLDADDAINRLMDILGTERFFRLARNIAAIRGEQERIG